MIKERRWRLLVDTVILGIVGALSARLQVLIVATSKAMKWLEEQISPVPQAKAK